MKGKRRGVIATKVFLKNKYVYEYAGELLLGDDAKHEAECGGTFMHFFEYKGRKL